MIYLVYYLLLMRVLTTYLVCFEGVDDILGLLSTADRAVDDILGLQSTSDT